MKDKLSELKDRIAKVQTIQRSANEMRESENGAARQMPENIHKALELTAFLHLNFVVFFAWFRQSAFPPRSCEWIT